MIPHMGKKVKGLLHTQQPLGLKQFDLVRLGHPFQDPQFI